MVLLPSQRSIPLSLDPFSLFKILPHLVVPGTMFSLRPAALFAALSMIVGVRFLDEPARVLLNQQKGTWLDVDTPENLSYECAKLLLRLPEDVGLTKEERNVYAGMRRYRLIELNFQSSLSAVIPWTPEKSTGVGDLQVVCKNCQKKRSVTMMDPDDDLCGFCVYERDRLAAIAKHVRNAKGIIAVNTAAQPEPSAEQVRWYECAMSSCKAQYVVLTPLNVRPKCYYCRNDLKCPWIECVKCTNRVIFPERYRGQLNGAFTCFACQSGKKTVVEEETNTKKLIKENGSKWLGFEPKYELFDRSSAFKLFSKYGPDVFVGLPSDQEPLMLQNKKVLNVDAIRLKIERRVATGEVEEGTCELCFNDLSYDELLPACGRSGCKQAVDEDCLERWYGENKPGRLLNPLQLACPFCRRTPVTKVLTKYNPRAMAVGDLANAVNDRAWYYAWCLTCGFAKRAVERACADNGLPNIRGFICDACTEARVALEARLRAEAEVLRAQQRTERERQRERAQQQQQTRRLEEIQQQLKLVAELKVVKITPCPHCKVYVEKTYGCNHITCKCGTHFCFIDGLQFSADKIYDHLQREHGGYGFDDGDGDDDEYDSE